MGGMNIPGYEIDGTDLKDSGNFSVEGIAGGNFGLFLGLDFGLLTGEAGALLSFDNAQISQKNSNGDTTERIYVDGVALRIPLLVKLDLHLGPVVLQPLVGPYFNFALGDLHMTGAEGGDDPYANPLLGLVFGGDLGLNLGRGILFMDVRYEVDLGKTVAGNDPMTLWRRSALMLNFGYQIYLGRKE
jgi:hypothetical protein